jgi:putative sigma-54 modulation protein
MRLLIKARPELGSARLKSYVARRARFALARFADAIATATVTMEDVNGIRGGIDKKCSILLRIPGRPDIAVRAVHEDAFAASDLAMAKARRALVRKLDRASARIEPRRGVASAVAASSLAAPYTQDLVREESS